MTIQRISRSSPLIIVLSFSPGCSNEAGDLGGADANARADSGAQGGNDAEVRPVSDAGQPPTATLDASETRDASRTALPAIELDGLPPVAGCHSGPADCTCAFVPHHLGRTANGAPPSHAVDGLGNVYVAYETDSGDGGSSWLLARFDMASRRWSELSEPALHDSASVAADAYGGVMILSRDATGSGRLHRFDPEAGAWLAPETPPGGDSTRFGVLTNAGRAAALSSAGFPYWNLHIYDPGSDTWRTQQFGSTDSAIPIALSEAGTAALGLNINSTLTSGYGLGLVSATGQITEAGWSYPSQVPRPVAEADGSGVFVYYEQATPNPPTYRVLSGRLYPGTEEPTDWVELGAADPSGIVELGYDSSGRAFAAWVHRGWFVGSFYSPETREWSPTQTIGTKIGGTPLRGDFDVAISHDGSATLAWRSDTYRLSLAGEASNTGETLRDAFAQYISRSGTVSPVYQLQVNPNEQVFDVSTSHRNGHAVVVWREHDQGLLLYGAPGYPRAEAYELWAAPRVCGPETELEVLGAAAPADSERPFDPPDAGDVGAPFPVDSGPPDAAPQQLP